MSHRRNLNQPGHAHELTFSCYRGYPFLKSARTCQWLSESIDSARNALEFDLWAYVFMPEHVHLIIRLRCWPHDVAEIRQAIKEPVARQAIAFLESQTSPWLERISTKKGNRIRRYFWQQGGGYDRNVVESQALMRMIDYIHLNPVRRGLVERAVDWRWSSAAWFQSMQTSPLRLDLIPPEWVPC